MASRLLHIRAIMFVVLTISIGRTGICAGEKSQPSQDRLNFRGKTVMFFVSNGYSLLLENAELKEIGDRRFVVGRFAMPKGCPHPYVGRDCAYPWAMVEFFVVFDSAEQFQKICDEYKEYKKAQASTVCETSRRDRPPAPYPSTQPWVSDRPSSFQEYLRTVPPEPPGVKNRPICIPSQKAR